MIIAKPFAMSRLKAILQSEYPYNITARCINKEWFKLPMCEVWDIFCDELKMVSINCNLQIHSFVLMSNHFHLIATTPQANISTCMHKLMSNTSKRLTRAGNRINETYAGRHYKCILQCNNYFLNAYKYNYRNPVTAGICKRVEDYEFSTLKGLLNPQFIKIPIIPDLNFELNPKETLKWLNISPDPVKTNAFRCGLKHQFFKSRKYKNTNKLIISEADLL